MADIQHNSLTGIELHVPGYVQDTDPGAVGAGKLWIDTSAGTGLWVTKVRNATDTGWEVAGSAASGVTTYTVTIIDGDLVAGVATIVHNLGSRIPLVTVYDNNYQAIVPDGIQSVDVNTLLIDLTSFTPLLGTWSIRVTV